MLSDVNSYYKSDTSLKNDDLIVIIDSLKKTKTSLLSKYSQENSKDLDKDLLQKIDEKISLIIDSEKFIISKTNHLVS